MSLVRTVVRSMEKIAPLRLAESWDNVGLLLEPTIARANANQILLTIDLTPSVLREALSAKTGMIIAYHPPIFKPLRALTQSNPLQSSLLTCAANGIAIYSPHTAIDAVTGGVNDWLIGAFGTSAVARTKYVGEKKEGGGEGRIVVLRKPSSVADLTKSIKSFLGLQYVQVAHPDGEGLDSLVNSTAICAGSGGSVLSGADADVYWTGEMSHHEVLAAVAAGKHVILCGHTNTERGYLSVLAQKLRDVLAEDDGGKGLIVDVSKADQEPLITM